MIYRYTVRDAADAVVTKHRNLLGALDSIAALRSRAKSESKPDQWHIYDDREKHVVDPVAALVEPDSDDLRLRLTRGQRAVLREVAAEVGALAKSGRTVGQPSEARLIQQIANRQLIVRKASEP
jgi:hypothetical protein